MPWQTTDFFPHLPGEGSWIKKTLLPSPLLLPPPPPPYCQLQITMGTAGPQLRLLAWALLNPRAPDRSGHRTSTTRYGSQCTARPQSRIPVGTAGSQPGAPDCSVGTPGPQPQAPKCIGHCPTSSTSSRWQWAHRRSSTGSSRLQWALPDLNRQIECQKNVKTCTR